MEDLNSSPNNIGDSLHCYHNSIFKQRIKIRIWEFSSEVIKIHLWGHFYRNNVRFSCFWNSIIVLGTPFLLLYQCLPIFLRIPLILSSFDYIFGVSHSIFRVPVVLINFLIKFWKKRDKQRSYYHWSQKIPNHFPHSLNVKFLTLITIPILYCFFQSMNLPKEYLSNIHRSIKTKIFQYKHSNCSLQRVWIRNVNLECQLENETVGRSYSSTDIDISFCFFTRTSTYGSSGGVIHVTGGSYYMKVSNTMFYNSACQGFGGAINFDSISSFITFICANKCTANTISHFAYLRASENNVVDYLSVTNCSYLTTGYDPIYVDSGNQRIDNSNYSLNKALENSGMAISMPKTFTSSHCTFSNNKASSGTCIKYYYNKGTLIYANIIDNNSPLKYGIFLIDGNSHKIQYCIFYNNHDTLFYIDSGSLEVSHCIISHSDNFWYVIPITKTYNNSIDTNSPCEIRQTYQIRYFNSHYCNADIPYVMQTPIRTFEFSPLPTITETLIMTKEITIENTFEETIPNTLLDSPISTPFRTYEETIMKTNEKTIENTFEETISNTLLNSPISTPIRTYEITIENTLLNSPISTPLRTFEETIMKTNEKTIENSIEETIQHTLVRSPISTPLSTNEGTHLATPDISPTVISDNSNEQTSAAIVIGEVILSISFLISATYSTSLILSRFSDNPDTSESLNEVQIP